MPSLEYKDKAEENITRLFKEKQLARLKRVKYLFSMCAKATSFVVICEVVIGFRSVMCMGRRK